MTGQGNNENGGFRPWTTMGRAVIFMLLLPLTRAAFAQGRQPSRNEDSSSRSSACIDPKATAACRSFQELLASKDQELLDKLTNRYVFVCFRQKDDVFFVLEYKGPTYMLPTEGSWLEELDSIRLDQYTRGVLDRSVIASGKWIKTSKDDKNPRFAGKSPFPGDDSRILIDPSTITISRSFVNVNGEKTNWEFLLQNSTGRFTETFNPAGAVAEHVGRCARYGRAQK